MQRNRRGFIQGLVVVGLLVGMAVIAGKGQAASGNGPYYATPSWDQKLPAATRFVVLADWNSEAVLDRETGLVWERSPGMPSQTWTGARTACLNSTNGGRKGWRLPSVTELMSLVDPVVSSNGLNLPAGHPFTNIQLSYWSASTYADFDGGGWGVNFVTGVGDVFVKSSPFPVWCVRGGMQESVY